MSAEWTGPLRHDDSSAETPQNNRSYALPQPQALQPVHHVNALPKAIETLMELVAKLPATVAPAQGAHIIRYALEATGTSVADVLQQAQHEQQQTLETARFYVQEIERFKAHIQQMEGAIQEHHEHAQSLSQLIDTFLLSPSAISIEALSEQPEDVSLLASAF